MNKNQALSHPEIELRSNVSSTLQASNLQNTTIVDLLEVYADHVNWKERLDHSSLLDHFREEDVLNRERPQPLRIFTSSFVEQLDFVDPHRLEAEPHLVLNTTAYWLRQRFGVSPLFFHHAQKNNITWIGNASLMRTEAGKRVALDGLYRFSSGHSAPVSHVWFSHSLLNGQSSTYIIHDCPEQAKTLILSFSKQRNPRFLRPLSIDAILVEHGAHGWGEELFLPRHHLVTYEITPTSQFTPSQTAEAVENLHSLSQRLYIINEHLTDLQEGLRYLVGVHRRLMDLLPGRYDPVDAESVHDSFEYLTSKTNTLRRWVVNYTKRTGIRINLFFNLAAQTDSRTNLEIARLSSKIAVSTQRDSSSMITMAAVTMFFLPGTFVSALFSMVFFDTKTNEDGGELLTIGRQWWLFPMITIPLTILVFATWMTWQRHRKRVDSRSLGIGDLTEVVEPESWRKLPNGG